ncbi:Sigma-70 region 2 [Gemmata sp. SH-PL17]|uniref:sigma factor n=1 Tax=Gemmata sp. SH-PL17 TaxID=1630693 RepID=UPI00078DB7D2|nr:sigma factor [Gemmata sp. SH-PL17]AMV26107.1 Sigma-70 region 2 [Gemmata sp. SH-PL17]
MKRLTDEQRALVEQFLPMARQIARSVCRNCKHLRADVCSDLFLELCVYARNYDPSRGVPFLTYTYTGMLRYALEQREKTFSNGFAGTLRADRYQRVPVVHLSYSRQESDSEPTPLSATIPSPYDYSTWSLADDQAVTPVPTKRKWRRDYPTGVRYVKRGVYQARYWLGRPVGFVNLGTFAESKYGSNDDAISAASHAYRAFQAHYRSGVPGRDVSDTIAHLKGLGIIPQPSHAGGRPRTKLAA